MINGTFQIESILLSRSLLKQTSKKAETSGLTLYPTPIGVIAKGKWLYDDGFQPLPKVLSENFPGLRMTQLQISIENARIPWSRSSPYPDKENYHTGELHFIDLENQALMKQVHKFECSIRCYRAQKMVCVTFDSLLGAREELISTVTGVLFKLMTVIELTRKAEAVITAFRKHLRSNLSVGERGYMDRVIKTQFEEIGALI